MEKNTVAAVATVTQTPANLATWLKLLDNVRKEIYEIIDARHEMNEPIDSTYETRADVIRFCIANPKIDPFMLMELSTWDLPDEVRAEIVTLSHVFDTLEIA